MENADASGVIIVQIDKTQNRSERIHAPLLFVWRCLGRGIASLVHIKRVNNLVIRFVRTRGWSDLLVS